MGIYTRLRNTAEKVITKFAKKENSTVYTETLYSPTGTPSYTVKAVFLPLKKGSTSEKDDSIELNLENMEKVRIIIFSTSAISLSPGWYISKNASVKYTIIDVNNVQPTDTQIYYDCIGEK